MSRAGTTELLSTANVAEALTISRSRVLALIRGQRLPAIKIGREWLIEKADLGMVTERHVGRPRAVISEPPAPRKPAGLPGQASSPRPAASPGAHPRPRTTYTLAIGAQKGGVAKTTTTLYLAARAAAHFGSTPEHPTVCILDRDEAQNLSVLARLDPDVIAPGVRLLEGSNVPAPAQGYRMVLVDTPPGLAALDALRDADLLVVPVLAEKQGVANLSQYLRLIEGLRRTTNPRLRLLAVLPTIVEKRNALHRDMLELIGQIAAQHYAPLHVLPPIPRANSIARVDLRATGYDAAAKELFDALG